jgi:hypothetical protein
VGSISLAWAARPDHPGVTVAIGPCLLFDTRAGAQHVGPRTAPVGSADTYNFVARDALGQCSLPNDAIALVMNVTIANPTADSFLTVYPGDTTRPLASNLNWHAGQAPRPNQVTSRVGADGSIAFFNLAGSVDVVADVVGYLSDSDTRSTSTTQTRVLDAYPAATTGTVMAQSWGCVEFDPIAAGSVRLAVPLPAGALITDVSIRAFDRSSNDSIAVVLHDVNLPPGSAATDGLASDTYTTPDSFGAVEPLSLHPEPYQPPTHTVYLMASANAHTTQLDFAAYRSPTRSRDAPLTALSLLPRDKRRSRHATSVRGEQARGRGRRSRCARPIRATAAPPFAGS